MKLLLIELDYHPEVLHGIFNHLDPSIFDVSVATTPLIFDRASIAVSESKLFLKNKNQHITDFLLSTLAAERFDLILFNTAQSRFFRLCKVSFEVPMIVLVHNVNAFFNRGNVKPRFSPFYLWKDFSYVLRIVLVQADFFFRPKFLKSVDRFVFPSHFMLETAQREKAAWKDKFLKKPISWVSTTEKGRKSKDQERFQITIVGVIDRRRRDYKQILSLIDFLKTSTKKSVVVYFAGRPQGSYGKKITQAAKNAENAQIQIRSFNQFLPSDELEIILKNTDLLVAPIVRKTRHHIWQEEYGTSKITGAIGNAITYGIPILLPSFYPVEEENANFIISYTDKKDLNEKALALILKQEEQKTLNLPHKQVQEKLTTALLEVRENKES